MISLEHEFVRIIEKAFIHNHICTHKGNIIMMKKYPLSPCKYFTFHFVVTRKHAMLTFIIYFLNNFLFMILMLIKKFSEAVKNPENKSTLFAMSSFAKIVINFKLI